MPPLIDVEVTAPLGRPRRLRLPGSGFVVGRSREARVRLPAEEISGAHARIEVRQGALWVEDLGSANGTWIDDERLPPGEPRPLPQLAELRVGPYRLRLSMSDDDAAAASQDDTDALAVHLVQNLMQHGAAPPASLHLRDPAGVDRVVVLSPGLPLRLGRDPRCELTVTDPDLSREHAVFLLDDEGATVTDLGSKNGVHRAGGRLEAQTRLRHGDELTLGGTRVRYEDPMEQWLAGRDEPEEAPDLATPTPADPEAAPPAMPHRPDVRAGQVSSGRSPSLVFLRVTRALVLLIAVAIMAASLWALWRLTG